MGSPTLGPGTVLAPPALLPSAPPPGLAELEALPTKQLRKRALSLGLDAQVVQGASDATGPHAALVALVAGAGASSSPPPPPASGGVAVKEFRRICTKADLATCAPKCLALTNGFLLSIEIDGRGTTMTVRFASLSHFLLENLAFCLRHHHDGLFRHPLRLPPFALSDPSHPFTALPHLSKKLSSVGLADGPLVRAVHSEWPDLQLAGAGGARGVYRRRLRLLLLLRGLRRRGCDAVLLSLCALLSLSLFCTAGARASEDESAPSLSSPP